MNAPTSMHLVFDAAIRVTTPHSKLSSSWNRFTGLGGSAVLELGPVCCARNQPQASVVDALQEAHAMVQQRSSDSGRMEGRKRRYRLLKGLAAVHSMD